MRRLISLWALSAVFALVYTGASFALGDGSSNSSDMPVKPGVINLQEELGRSVLLTAGIERVFERNLDDDGAALSGEMEGNFFLLGASYRIKNLYEPYLRLGLANVNTTWSQGGAKIEMDSEYDLAIGGGFKMLAYKGPITSLAKLKVVFDGQLRYISPSIDTVTIAGVDRSRNVNARELSIFEGRAAAIAGIEISLKNLAAEEEEDEEEWLKQMLFMPYAGLCFMNSVTTAKFEFGGTDYGFTDTNQEYNFGAVAGLDIISPDYVIFNLEGQVMSNDRSASGGFNIKF